jgi:hypothetical protein
LFNRPKSRENIPDKRFPTKTALQGLSPDDLHGRVPNLHITREIRDAAVLLHF